MLLSPFHAMYIAIKLSSYAFGYEKLIGVYASSDIEVYPYQIASAMFALRSRYLKGAVICDEGGLGKSYSGLLAVAQKWYEGNDRVLVVTPTPLLHQWITLLDTSFTLPFIVVDSQSAYDELIANGQSNPFVQEAIVITTYDFAIEKSEEVKQAAFQVALFEEAHFLRRIYTGENKGALALKEAVYGAFKLLLTATPMQNSIMDLYGLINFIDDTVFADEKTFYAQYFRRPENYPELASRVSRYCFRTLKRQVKTYVKLPERIPITLEFTPSEKEERLYNLLEKYINMPDKKAFPKMDKYRLTFTLIRLFSSSTAALRHTLAGVANRLKKLDKADDELAQINDMLALADSIKENTKGSLLLTALKDGFKRLKTLGASKKALIFTENRETQKYLYGLLSKGKYKGKVITFNGDKSRDYTIMERFKNEAEILITTDIAAEGFNLSFCSLIINYDMPYNVLKIEQRINRCHRIGQQNDCFVINFLNRNSFADVRMLELINKRILQFDGIFGSTDDVIGNFSPDLSESYGKILETARTKDEIDRAFNAVLSEFEPKNKQLVTNAEETLYATFSNEISAKLTITPQYVKDKTEEINKELWELTKFFFQKSEDYKCIDETRTVRISLRPHKVFTGTKLGRNEYSIDDKTLPKSGRHTVTGVLARNIISELFWRGIQDKGEVYIKAGKFGRKKCQIGYYEVKFKSRNSVLHNIRYDIFVGVGANGEIISDDECRRIMALPVERFTAFDEIYGDKDGISKPKRHDPTDDLVDIAELRKKAATESDSAVKDEIDKLKAYNTDLKLTLNRGVEALKRELASIEQKAANVTTRLEKLDIQKQLISKQRELKQRKQSLFMDGIKMNLELENEIMELVDNAELEMVVKRIFLISVREAQ